MRTIPLILLPLSLLCAFVACSENITEADGDTDYPVFDGDINHADGDIQDGDIEDDNTSDGDEQDGDREFDSEQPPADGDSPPSDGDTESPDGDMDGEIDLEGDEETEEPEDRNLCPEGQRCTLLPDGPRVCMTPDSTIPQNATTSCDPTDAESCGGNQSCVCIGGDCAAQGGVCLERCGACRSGYFCRLLSIAGAFSCKDMANRWSDGVVSNCHEGTACPAGTFCFCQRRTPGGACENSVCAESCTAVWDDDLCEDENTACGSVPSLDPNVFGCLYGGALIPEDARRQCFRYDEEKCPSTHSCHCLDGTGIDCHQSVCIRNCGRCQEGETCEKPLLIGTDVCLVGGQVPPGAARGCGGLAPQTTCPQNYTCHLFGGQYVCLQHCSPP